MEWRSVCDPRPPSSLPSAPPQRSLECMEARRHPRQLGHCPHAADHETRYEFQAPVDPSLLSDPVPPASTLPRPRRPRPRAQAKRGSLGRDRARSRMSAVSRRPRGGRPRRGQLTDLNRSPTSRAEKGFVGMDRHSGAPTRITLRDTPRAARRCRRPRGVPPSHCPRRACSDFSSGCGPR